MTQPDTLTARLLSAMEYDGLSLSAKGALSHLVALRVANEKITMDRILYKTKSGRTALNSALRELEEAGYLARTRRKDNVGMMAGYHWEIFPDPKCPF